MPSPEVSPHAARRQELETRFALVHLEKAKHEELVKRHHDELMRIQGALAELETLDHPDQPTAG